ncbi:cysteine--tRNA ligase [Candidatus Nitrospira bockiana]
MGDAVIKIHNTISGRKEIFEPLVPGTVRMYVCGVTVYDYCHLGHARSALVFDIVRRYLEHRGFTVTFVKNFTDIDDKIINRAREQGVPWQSVTARYIEAYHEDMARLGVRAATIEPKATDHIPDIIRLVQSLLDKGVAYRIDGDVYFDVNRFTAYGALSKRKLEELQAGARVEVDERKRHPMDFALWKAAKSGEPAWESPWGPGRPGWHIECSAMSMKHLGETFDIHGGGEDLIFPHHENEIAQSSASTGKPFARYWIHNGFVRVNQEKMSKSLGNFFTIREIFAKSRWAESVTAEMLRYFLLSTHYRSPLDFSDLALEEAKRAVDGFYGLFQRLEEPQGTTGTAPGSVDREIAALRHAFEESMDDDFNTPAALAAFQRLRAETNRLLAQGLSSEGRRVMGDAFRKHGAVLGLFQLPVAEWQFNPETHDERKEARGAGHLSEAQIEAKLRERQEARRRKDFSTADEIRELLSEHGITIEDRPDGTSRWKR